MKTTSIRRWLLAPLATAVLALAGCDNPIGGGDEHPDGLVVLSGGTEIAAYTDNPRSISGGITLGVGATQTYRVQLTTRSGARRTVDGAEYRLGQPTVLLASRANVRVEGNDQLVVTGLVADATTIILPVHHGGHVEFDARINLVLQ